MSAEQKLNELAELARLCRSMKSNVDLNMAYANFITRVEPEDLIAIAEAFADMKQRAESAEAENNRLSRNYQSVIEQNMPRTGDGCDEGWSRVIEAQELQQKLTAAEAIVADVEEVINLLSEREWAEHCTKTDTGKRLEEAITELHNEAAPDEQPAPPVFGYMRVVSGQSFQIMEGTQRPPDRSGNGAGPWFAIYRQPPAAIKLADLVPGRMTPEDVRWHIKSQVHDDGPACRIEHAENIGSIMWNDCISAILRNIEESEQ